MIKVYSNLTDSELFALVQRPQMEENSLDATINEVFSNVKSYGDEQLKRYTLQFDKVQILSIKVDEKSLFDAYNEIDLQLKAAILVAKSNIEKFHQAQLPSTVSLETMPGVKCIQKPIAIERVGIYIPGGTAPLFSTILMLAIPAMIAGCKEIVLCSPPTFNGAIHPAILATAYMCGITEVYQIGGSQAVAAMALGTESIKKVAKIFGPGNQYVTAAKEKAQKYGVAMDMPAGPSEVLVYADATCVPAYVAADLLSQAEHGVDSQVVCVVSNAEIATQINLAIADQIEELPRKNLAAKALENSLIIVEEDVDRAFAYINAYAPEHFIIASDNAENLAERVINAGSVFMGNYCPESVGDYASGTNHTLPTYGWASSYSGVNVDAFLRKVTFQSVTREGLVDLGKVVIIMAEAEQLQAHANAVKIRLMDQNISK